MGKIWNLVERKDLFRQIHSSNGHYSSLAHIAEMIALLGLPPKELIDREKEGLRWRFRPEVENSEGKLCGNASEFYGGPFFDSEGTISRILSNIDKTTIDFYLGEFKHKHLVPDGVNLSESVVSIEGEDKKQFLIFVRKMLQWLPEKRLSARELLEDQWLSRESIEKGG